MVRGRLSGAALVLVCLGSETMTTESQGCALISRRKMSDLPKFLGVMASFTACDPSRLTGPHSEGLYAVSRSAAAVLDSYNS